MFYESHSDTKKKEILIIMPECGLVSLHLIFLRLVRHFFVFFLPHDKFFFNEIMYNSISFYLVGYFGEEGGKKTKFLFLGNTEGKDNLSSFIDIAKNEIIFIVQSEQVTNKKW